MQRTCDRHVVLSRPRRIGVAEEVWVWVALHDGVGTAPLEALLDVAVPPSWREAQRLLVGMKQT